MRLSSLALLTASIGIGLTAYAQAPAKSAAKGNVANGKELYRQHCSACHGVAGKGDGSMYDPLSADPSKRVKPADLTALSEPGTGKFPDERFRNAIYAKGPVRQHGTPEMPAWGDVFYTLKSNPKQLETRVRDLTAFVQSIQAK